MEMLVDNDFFTLSDGLEDEFEVIFHLITSNIENEEHETKNPFPADYVVHSPVIEENVLPKNNVKKIKFVPHSSLGTQTKNLLEDRLKEKGEFFCLEIIFSNIHFL